MERVRFWGNSFVQLQSLPSEARAAFAWAILDLEKAPGKPPSSLDLDISTGPMRGEPGLFRIAVHSNRHPPGYRGVYIVRRGSVYFIRFRRRDPTTYQGFRKDLTRLLQELRTA